MFEEADAGRSTCCLSDEGVSEPGNIVGVDVRYSPENQSISAPACHVVAVALRCCRRDRRCGPAEDIDEMPAPPINQRCDDPSADIVDTASHQWKSLGREI